MAAADAVDAERAALLPLLGPVFPAAVRLIKGILHKPRQKTARKGNPIQKERTKMTYETDSFN